MNILVLTCRFGMGHYSAATAVKQQIHREHPDWNVCVADIFEEGTGELSSLIYSAHSLLVGRGSRLYNRFYTGSEHSGQSAIPLQLSLFLRPLKRLLERTRADMVVSTFSFTSQLCDLYISKTGRDLPYITVVTDVHCHTDWVTGSALFYTVAGAETRDILLSLGIESGRILVTGVPVRHGFEPCKRPNDGVRRLLISGGGLGLMPRSLAFYKALSAMPDVKATVICGKNTDLQRSLDGRFDNVTALGYVTDYHNYLKLSDAILGKPGGITLFEAIACQVPMISIKPFLAQEQRNAQFLEEHGMGVVLRDLPHKSLDVIAQIIADPALLEGMRENMRLMSEHFEPGALCAAIERAGVRHCVA